MRKAEEKAGGGAERAAQLKAADAARRRGLCHPDAVPRGGG